MLLEDLFGDFEDLETGETHKVDGDKMDQDGNYIEYWHILFFGK